jgi:hypothetical protein
LARKLTKLDEWPLHQTIDTFDSVATASQNWSDGFWNCVGDPEGKVNLITAIRFYQNTNVADGYACVTLDDGKQYNLRCSRRLRPRIDELDVGPLWMDIIEGLRTFRFGCRENAHGIEFDLLWEASAPAWDETSGQTGYMDGRIAFQRSNYVQLGNVSGTLRVAGRDFQVGPDWVGARDHSWGLGGDSGTGGKIGRYVAPPGGVRHPSSKPAFGMRQWSLFRLPNRSIYYWFHHGNDGTISPFKSHIGYPFESDRAGRAYKSAQVESAEFKDGLRRLERAVVAFERYDGRSDRFSMEVVSKPLYMQGGGYWQGFEDGLGRGIYRGEDHVEGEIWDVSHPTKVLDLKGQPIPQKQGAWAETFARFENLDDPEEKGLGLLECVVGGPYPGVEEPE